MPVPDNEKVRSIAFSIAEAAEKLGPHAVGLDEIFGTQLRSSLVDLRSIDRDLWASVEAAEEEEEIKPSFDDCEDVGLDGTLRTHDGKEFSWEDVARAALKILRHHNLTVPNMAEAITTAG